MIFMYKINISVNETTTSQPSNWIQSHNLLFFLNKYKLPREIKVLLAAMYFVHNNFLTYFRLSDNLPCATQFKIKETGEDQYEHGYKLGFTMNEKVFKIDTKQTCVSIFSLWRLVNGQTWTYLLKSCESLSLYL